MVNKQAKIDSHVLLTYICQTSDVRESTSVFLVKSHRSPRSFSQFRAFSQFRIIQIEEYLILLNYSSCEFKLLLEKVNSFNDISI